MPSVNYKGVNEGMGNRHVADRIKQQHQIAAHSTDWVSSTTPPNKSAIAHAPGAKSSVLKSPRATKRPMD